MTTVSYGATAAICTATPTVQVIDNRGLPVRRLQFNRTVAGETAHACITQQRYGASGQLLSSLDPRLFAEQQRDPAVRPNFRYQRSLTGQALSTQSQDAGDQVVLYDSAGSRRWQLDSRGQGARYAYDPLHRLVAVYEQDGAAAERISERYRYGEGESASTNGRGRLVAHYDTAGLNETPRYSLSGQALVSARRLLQTSVPASDWQGDTTAWEAALEQQAYTSRQGFDGQGRMAWSLDAKGNRQQPQFNVVGQLLSSQLTLAGQSSSRVLLRRVSYNAAGQVQWEEAGNGVVSDYRYEAQTQRLSRLTVSRPAQNGRSTLLQDLDYQYDPVGNILAIRDAAQAIRYHQNQRIAPSNAYQYDALYQLLSATGRENADAGQQGPSLPLPQVPLSADANRYSNYTRSYSYDRGGNLTQIRHQGSSNYTQDLIVAPTSNRAVAQTGFLTPADVDGHFDAAGNLQQLAARQPLAWDGRNQLQEVLQVSRDGAADDREWYRYDGGGQRLLKTSVSQTHATLRQAEVIYLPGLELRRTLSVQGDTQTTVEELQVIRGQGAGRSQVRILHWDAGQPAGIPNDQLRYSLDNQIGSSLLELDQAADILTLEEYFPFGGTAVWAGRSASETQYKFVRYSGKERDATGLYYYGLRYYAPWIGRWLNPDPAGTVDGLNLYRMVRNNPITLSDPDGRMPKRKDNDASKHLSAAELDTHESVFESETQIYVKHEEIPGGTLSSELESQLTLNIESADSGTADSKKIGAEQSESRSASGQHIEQGLSASTENHIDVTTSELMSSDGELDFIWVPKVNTDKLSAPNPNSPYFPSEGVAALFLHCDDAENVYIKGFKFPPENLAKQLKRLPGFDELEASPFILSACRAGCGGKQSVAQRISDIIRRPVIASTGLVKIGANADKTVLTEISSDEGFLKFYPIPLFHAV
jgi:insecticidal toxin complex protein TccC